MGPRRLLVIAPDADYRQSLAFVLEAEGFAVADHPGPPLPPRLAGEGFACTVLDLKSLRGLSPEVATSFCAQLAPAVLLGPRAPEWLAGTGCQHVETPIIEDRLLAAVRAAIAAPPRSAI